VFTCVVNVRGITANSNNARWMNNMGNTITRGSTNPYVVNNGIENVGQDRYLTSTLTITNVNTQQAGLYQFVLGVNNDDVMSREAFLSVLKGTYTLKFFVQVPAYIYSSVSLKLLSIYQKLELLYLVICD